MWGPSGGLFGTIARLIILTGWRRGEIAALLRTYYSHNEQTVTLPGQGFALWSPSRQLDDWVALAKSDESLVLGVGDDLFYPPQIAHAIGGNLSMSPLRQPFLDAGWAASRTS